MFLSAVIAAATVALTPSSAVEQARAMVLVGVGESGQAQFRHVRLRSVGSDMVFCGQVNTRTPDGALTGWRDVLVLISGNANGDVVMTGALPYQRDLIAESCRHGALVNDRDYSAALSAGF